MPEPQLKDTTIITEPLDVLYHMLTAQNRHDLEGMLAFFSRDYISEQPFHPERNFVGKSGVRTNWGLFFNTFPDIQADILSEAVDRDTVWAELLIHGTHMDGKLHTTRGVTISRIKDGLIVWARLYIETLSAERINGGVA